MNKSEEEQLLQDASSLLMFANLAAKQRVHVPQPPSQLQLPVPVPQRHNLVSWSQGQRILPSPSAHNESIHGHQGPQSHQIPQTLQGPQVLPPHLRGYQNNNPYSPNTGPSNSITSAQPTPLSSANTPRHSMSGSLSSSLPLQHSNISEHIRRSSVHVGNSPPSVNRPSPISIASLTSPMVSNAAVVPVKKPFDDLLNPTEPVPVQPVLKPKPEHKLSVGDLLSKETPKSLAQPLQNSVPPPQHALPPLKSSAHILANSGAGPVDTKQATLHKRTSSNGYHHSPGPADIALMRGIMDTSSAPRVHDARIAAAALAAAADIPLPLRKDGVEGLQDKKAENTKKDKKGSNLVKGKRLNTKVENVKAIKAAEKVSEQASEQISGQNAGQIGQSPDQNVRSNTQNSSSTHIKQEQTKLLLSTPKAVTEQTTQPVKETTTEPVNEPVIDLPLSPTSETVSEPVKDVSTSEIHESVQPTPVGSSVGNHIVNSKAPPLESYKVDADSGLIGCICGIDDDDGFTVQCDICYRWQHCLCMNFTTNEEIPDEYECYYCDESKWGKFDAEKCKKDTLERLGLDNPPTPKKDMKRKSLGSSETSKKRKTLESRSKKKDDEDKSKTELLPDSALGQNGKEEVSFLPNPQNDQLEGGMCVELYQGTYYKLRSNDFKTPEIRKILESIEQSQLDGVECLTKAEFQRKYTQKFSHRILPKFDSLESTKSKLPTQSNRSLLATSIQVKPYSENQKQKFNGIQKLGLFVSASSESHTIPRGTPITEYLGEISLFLQYKQDKVNQYSSWGTTKPRVVQASIPLKDSTNTSMEIVSDARFVGNEARFIRNSCPAAANCELQVVYIKDQMNFSLIVVTTKDITLNKDVNEEELRLEWQWDNDHPIRKMFDHEQEGKKVEGIKFDQFSETEKSKLIPSVDTLLTFVECACSTASSKAVPGYQANCVLFKIKKATAYLLRSTRKVLLVSSLNMSKSRDALILNKKPKEYISWDERLHLRDEKIAADLEVTVVHEDEETASAGNVGDENNDEESALAGDISMVESQLAETDVINEELRETKSWNSVSYKEKLLAKSRTLREINVKVDSTDANEITEICAPIVPDLVIKIQKAVREKIEVPALNVDLKISPEEVVKEATTSVLPPVAAPLPVKKLSFADYKKKMK